MVASNSQVRPRQKRGRKPKHSAPSPRIATKESSCATCRVRKVKCSGGRPACTSCLKAATGQGVPASSVQCLYSAASIHATVEDQLLEAKLGRGSKCVWGEEPVQQAASDGKSSVSASGGGLAGADPGVPGGIAYQGAEGQGKFDPVPLASFRHAPQRTASPSPTSSFLASAGTPEVWESMHYPYNLPSYSPSPTSILPTGGPAILQTHYGSTWYPPSSFIRPNDERQSGPGHTHLPQGRPIVEPSRLQAFGSHVSPFDQASLNAMKWTATSGGHLLQSQPHPARPVCHEPYASVPAGVYASFPFGGPASGHIAAAFPPTPQPVQLDQSVPQATMPGSLEAFPPPVLPPWSYWQPLHVETALATFSSDDFAASSSSLSASSSSSMAPAAHLTSTPLEPFVTYGVAQHERMGQHGCSIPFSAPGFSTINEGIGAEEEFGESAFFSMFRSEPWAESLRMSDLGGCTT